MDKKRIKFLIYFTIIIAILISIRLVVLQVFQHSFYKEKAESQRKRFIKKSSDRGEIFDRNGNLLATTINSYSIYINPSKFSDYSKLSKILRFEVPKVSKNKTFAWVKRQMDGSFVNKLKEAELEGAYYLIEKKRVYPKKRIASQVIGFVGIDNNGLAGIELTFDDYLKGEEGWVRTESDPMGYELFAAHSSKLKEESVPSSLTLTIDETIQYFAENEVEEGLKKFSAKWGLAIVMDVKSGEILALAGKPDFDPNYYGKFNVKLWNSPACSVYEPGSTFKIITLAAGLASGIVDDNTKLKALDKIKIGGKVIENAHPIDWTGRYISLSKMIEESINTGAVQVGVKLGKKKFYEWIKKFDFGERTKVGLPGESRGIVRHFRRWHEADVGMISFGQGIGVTPIQLLAAISAIANDGVYIRPRLVKKIERNDASFIKVLSSPKKRILDSHIAEKVKKYMENVVLKGTGRGIKLKNFSIAGKTGTAQKVIPGRLGYVKGHYVSSFVAFAPVEDPKISILVIFDDPKGEYWGATVAGPVLKNIMKKTLYYLYN